MGSLPGTTEGNGGRGTQRGRSRPRWILSVTSGFTAATTESGSVTSCLVAATPPRLVRASSSPDSVSPGHRSPGKRAPPSSLPAARSRRVQADAPAGPSSPRFCPISSPPSHPTLFSPWGHHLLTTCCNRLGHSRERGGLLPSDAHAGCEGDFFRLQGTGSV